MVAAGYDPNAFSEFFSRLVEEKAKSGNWFTNIFGSSNPTEKRLREMIKVDRTVAGSVSREPQRKCVATVSELAG